MNVLVDCPQSSAGEWRFRLFDVDVRVKFWFWLTVVLLCGAQDTAGVLVWVVVCFASILIHELGHVFAFRFYRQNADIVLYGWGGLTIPYHRVHGSLPQFVVALAGPAAGFAVTAATLVTAVATGARVGFGWRLFFPVLVVGPGRGLWSVLLNDLLWVNFYWGLMNLLPVYPLDGGHAARAVLEQHDPVRGRRRALILSAVAAGAMAAAGAVSGSLYLLLGFVVLAASSLQALEGERSGTPRPYQRWRG